VLGVGSVVSLLATSLAVRPLAPVFELHREVGKHTLVGREIVVQTLTVDHRFGQARLDTDGSDLILSVRCPSPNTLKKGATALIIDYDPQKNTYLVEPMDALLGSLDAVEGQGVGVSEPALIHESKEA
jgi:hypothetical protein